MDLVPKKSLAEGTKIVQEKKIEDRWIGSLTIRKGMRVYEWADGKVIEAKYSRCTIGMDGVIKKELQTNRFHRYTTAINLKNAIRRFRKGGLVVDHV